eukprot:4589377-Alexandrium_andersonii.AAC.1
MCIRDRNGTPSPAVAHLSALQCGAVRGSVRCGTPCYATARRRTLQRAVIRAPAGCLCEHDQCHGRRPAVRR